MFSDAYPRVQPTQGGGMLTISGMNIGTTGSHLMMVSVGQTRCEQSTWVSSNSVLCKVI